MLQEKIKWVTLEKGIKIYFSLIIINQKTCCLLQVYTFSSRLFSYKEFYFIHFWYITEIPFNAGIICIFGR